MHCHLNQVVVDCRGVLFRPRDYDVQFDAACRVILLLPQEYAVDERSGYIEVDFDPWLPDAMDMIVHPSNYGGSLPKTLRRQC